MVMIFLWVTVAKNKPLCIFPTVFEHNQRFVDIFEKDSVCQSNSMTHGICLGVI
jgi:hypothetical protein